MSCDNGPTVPETPEAASRPRELTDPRTMRALTHPVRQALLELLLTEGPLTATQAGERIGEPPNTCSFHFRQLAKYGFVEEAGPAPGRSRPWRLTTHRMHFTDLHEDPDTAVAARGLDRMLRERYFERLAAFYESRSGYPLAWQETTGGSQALLHVTPEELKAIDEQIMAVLDPYRDRGADPAKRPADSLPIEVLLFAYPVRPPAK
jgi:predicted ArsR family transcriptional regulator